MTDLIIVLVLAVILVVAGRSCLKRFRGETSCCSGSTYKARKKKLDTVVARKTLSVEGMTCQHCVNRVMEAVQSIDGASADVKLSKGLVVVSMSRPIEETALTSAIENAGYTVTGVA